jgi:hypothetical protein
MVQVTEMMSLRQAGLDDRSSGAVPDWPPFSGIRVDAGRYLSAAAGPGNVPEDMARAVAGRLLRHGEPPGPGAVTVCGLMRFFTLEEARSFHEALFGAVWSAFSLSAGLTADPDSIRFKTGVIADGAIPEELYGSSWSFKSLHIDRDALLFSHLYGPVDGFAGGELLLVDAVRYMRLHSLGFRDVFEWSQEPSAGSKPVLRPSHAEPALAECGVNIGSIGPDEILFVNNLPAAGILHGATPVTVTDPVAFRRDYHRCSVKSLRPC